MTDRILLQDIVSAEEINDCLVVITRSPQVAGYGEIPDCSTVLRHNLHIPARSHFTELIWPTLISGAQTITNNDQSGLRGSSIGDEIDEQARQK
jgi:hypothetical protein